MKKLRLIVAVMIAVLAIGAISVGCSKGNKYEITVIGPDGNGVAGVELKASVQLNGQDIEEIATGTTDKNGVFKFKAKSGEYTITALSIPAGYELENNNPIVTSKESNKLTIQLVQARSDYEVNVVTSDGVAVPDVLVNVTSGSQPIASGATDKGGVYSFRALAADYNISVDNLPSGFKYSSTEQKEENGKFIVEIKIVPVEANTRTYTVTVQSYGELEVPTAQISVISGTSEVASGATRRNGKFIFAAAPGVYNISVVSLPDGYSVVDTSIEYKTSATEFDTVIQAKSEVIAAPIAEDKVYVLGDIIHDFTITDPTEGDKQYTLSEVLKEKKMVLLNFWNTNCSPCMGEMPELDKAYRDYKDVAEVFALNVPLMGDNNARDLRNTRNNTTYTIGNETYNLSFPMAIDGEQMPLHFNMNSIPVTVIVDRYGIICEKHIGSTDRAGFSKMFETYTAEDYVPTVPPGGVYEQQTVEIVQREEPTGVSMPSSKTIEDAINDASYKFGYYGETGEDAKFSWPWLVGNDNGTKYIYPSNTQKGYSFATIYSDFTISPEDFAVGKKVLAFDMKYETENRCDYLYIIINNKLVYECTGTEHWSKWETCYALVAEEPGDYQLALLYDKDQQNSYGNDTVWVKNMRIITTNDITVGSLDMPRDAAKSWNDTTKSFEYVNAVLGTDGFYHKDTNDGPYILANLYERTPFNTRLGGATATPVNEYAINGRFNYNNGGAEADDPSYNPALDKTNDITKWLQAANNSELPGLTTVNAELAGLLNEFVQHMSPSGASEKSWIEFCTYFDHFGTDPTDTGINRFERNPIRGLMFETAYQMVAPHSGEFGKDGDGNLIIDNQYKNKVVQDRFIVPRGFHYKITPSEAGVYRFRSQSAELSDTMAWLRNSQNEIIAATDEQKENADENFNFVLTYYLEANTSYYLAVALADVSVTGEFTFTTEYLGPSAYVWQFASRNEFTSELDEQGNMTKTINYFNVKPIRHRDGYYYNAVKDENGNYTNEPNLDDPIYVDFLTQARFFEDGTLQATIVRGSEERIRATISGVLKSIWQDAPALSGDQGYARNTMLSAIKGSAVESTDLAAIITRLQNIYGEEFVGVVEVINTMGGLTTIGALTDIIRDVYINLFNFTQVTFPDIYVHITPDMYIDYTSTMETALNQALANTGNPNRGYADKGCVMLNDTLMNALKMLSWRLGNFADVETDYIRFCAHYEYMGPKA